MARFFGEIGFGIPTEIRPSVWEDQIVEREYYGDVKQNTRYVSTANSILGEAKFQTTISIMADAEAFEKYLAIKYIKWAGSLWTVSSTKVERPRLILMLGEVYNGPRAETPAG